MLKMPGASVPRRLLGMIAMVVMLAGCGRAGASEPGRPAARVPSRPTVTEAQLVAGQAALFMAQFKRHDFSAQWGELAPVARAAWPSRQGRALMLSRKFGGIAVQSVRLGSPVRSDWTSQESPRLTVARTWQVPVAVRFAAPSRLQPAGVAALYGRLALYLTAQGRRIAVIGEGPASIDAPLIDPARPANVQTHVPILMYHLVGAFPLRQQWTDSYGYNIEYGLTVPTVQFAGEMRYLASHGYTAISLTRLADTLLYGLPAPSHAVALTFDDGRESPWENAVPLLRRYGFTATFFVCSGFVGQTNETPAHLNVQTYLTWPQVSDLAREGFWVEDHGQKDINVLWTVSPTLLRQEVRESADLLSAHTNQPVQFLAYTGALWPYPQASEAGPAQTALFGRLKSLGYAGAAVDARVPSTLETSTQLWQLPRVRVYPNESLAQFAASLRG